MAFIYSRWLKLLGLFILVFGGMNTFAINYASSSTLHPQVNAVAPGENGSLILRLEINMVSGGPPKSLESLSLTTTGSTNPLNDLVAARAYFTGGSTVFSTATPFGTTFLNPNGAFSFTGSQSLSTGANYVWVVYDIAPGATVGNVVDAECGGFQISGTTYSPTPTAPAGNRPIALPSTTFQFAFGVTGGDFGNDLIQTNDNGYLLTGYSYGFGAGNEDHYLIKLDDSGNEQWSLGYGGTQTDIPEASILLQDGNYLIAGKTSSFGSGDLDFSLMKLDPSGAVLWASAYGTANWNQAWGVTELSDQTIVAVGQTDGFGPSIDAYLIRTDNNGNLLWSRTLSTPGIDALYGVIESIDGSIVVTGTARSATNQTDLVVAKFSVNGVLQWANMFGGTGNEYGWELRERPDGRIVVVGFTTTFGAGGADALLLELSPLGNLNWARTIGAPGTDYAGDTEVTLLADGSMVFTGHTNSAGAGGTDFMLYKVDSLGFPIWGRVYGGASTETPHGLTTTRDGGFAIIGETFSFGATPEMYIVKTDPLGFSSCNETIPPIVTSSPAVVLSTGVTIDSGGVATPFVPVLSNPTTVQTVLCRNIVLDAGPITFAGRVAGNTVSLAWDGLDERAVSELVVNRFSADEPATPIARFTDTQGIPTGFMDIDVPAGTWEYQLLFTDVNGASGHSEVLQFEVAPGAAPFRLHPQPAGDIVTITYEDAPADRLAYEIYSLAGRRVKVGVATFEDREFSVDLSDMPRGIYLFKMDNHVMRLIRQ